MAPSKKSVLVFSIFVVAITTYASTLLAGLSAEMISVKAGLAAVFAVLVLLTGKAIAGWEKKAAAPTLTIKTKSESGLLSVQTTPSADSIDTATLSFHVPGHVTDVQFPGTAFQGKIDALVIGGDDASVLSNRVELRFDRLSAHQARSALIYFKKSKDFNVRLFDEDAYEVLYSWWFKGERTTERFLNSKSTDKKIDDWGIRNNIVRLVSDGKSWGVLTGSDFYKVNGREPNYQVKFLDELGVKQSNKTVRSRFGIKRWKSDKNESSSETFWSVEWTESEQTYRERISMKVDVAPSVKLYSNQ